MNNVFGLLAGVVASLLGIATRELFNWYRARQKLQAAIEVQFQEALASDSLNVLGNYLDNAVGQFSVAEYGHNQEVRRRVNMFLARVEEFVGKTDDVHPAERVGRTPVQILPAEAPQDIDLQVIEERVLGGAVWDGLALLRRVIEQRLRQLALQRGLTVPQRPGASRLVELLRRNEVGNDTAWVPLLEAITVCNRAVHGLDVSTSEALEVVRMSRQALNTLGLTRTTKNGED